MFAEPFECELHDKARDKHDDQSGAGGGHLTDDGFEAVQIGDEFGLLDAIHDLKPEHAGQQEDHHSGLADDGGDGDAVQTEPVPHPGDAKHEERVQSDIGKKRNHQRALHRARVAMRLQDAIATIGHEEAG